MASDKQPLLVLMVAEKPSIASTLAEVLCPTSSQLPTKRRGTSPSSPVYEYDGIFMDVCARFRVTATTGHVYSINFAKEYNQWEKHGPHELFHAQTVREYDPRANIPEHLRVEAQGCDILVLWLDCDREGENICFEVMDIALPQMMVPRESFPQAYRGCVYRARFSSLAPQDLLAAMNYLAQPNENEALSVDARQELDLRVGVAFSRLQTMYFRKHFGHQLGKLMVTYGPCQIPTLWFCVKRHSDIMAFVPLPYWTLSLTLTLNNSDPTTFQARLARGSIWDAKEAKAALAAVKTALGSHPETSDGSGSPTLLRVTSVRTWVSSRERPRPLNTVEMLKMASEVLGLGPADALHSAEQLYLKGVMSYPRTETDKYADNFDLEGTVRTLSEGRLPWSGEADKLLKHGLAEPRMDGYDVGDHPPITPVRAATPSQCGSGWALYEEVCRHFLATVSPDAEFREAEATFIVGDEVFSARSVHVTSQGWAGVARIHFEEEGSIDIANAGLHEGSVLEVSKVGLMHHLTTPPRHLTESALLELMDRHSIGTDASMATHVGNVQRRGYVELDEQTREMRPSPLGLALCYAYTLIDPGLVLPTVRASIENACVRIAEGEASLEHVVRDSLRIFEKKFYVIARQLDHVPLMLAMAYAQERASTQPVSVAAGDGLELWKRAAEQTCRTSLDDLLQQRETAGLDQEHAHEDDQGGVEGFDLTATLAENTEVLRVQQVLNDLGFGPATPATEDSGSTARRQNSDNNPGRRSNMDHGHPSGLAPPERDGRQEDSQKSSSKGKSGLRGKKRGSGGTSTTCKPPSIPPGLSSQEAIVEVGSCGTTQTYTSMAAAVGSVAIPWQPQQGAFTPQPSQQHAWSSWAWHQHDSWQWSHPP